MDHLPAEDHAQVGSDVEVPWLPCGFIYCNHLIYLIAVVEHISEYCISQQLAGFQHEKTVVKIFQNTNLRMTTCYLLSISSSSTGCTALLRLGGHTALCKVQCTKVMEYCAREAAQIFGGLSYSRGGQGEKVERLNREVRAMAIPGGSEEIMLDLGVKQSTKLAQMAKMFAEAAPQAQGAKL